MIKARIIIMSHLSDISTTLGMKDLGDMVNHQTHKINFVKYLLLKYPNTNVDIDADEEWELFWKGRK